MYKFEQLAERIKGLIENGTWSADMKLPSLRSQAQSTGLSMMTVLNAYQELEAQGLIYSKEKAGFFVAHQQKNPLIPQNSQQLNMNNKIEINSLVFNYLKKVQNQDFAMLASAFPNDSILDNYKLRQIISNHAKNVSSYMMNDNMPPGNLALRKWIASRYQVNGVYADADDIVITSGALDALNLSLQALTQAGDYIILQESIFYGAWQTAERLKLKVITIPDDYQHGFNLQAFENALKTYPVKVCWLMLNSHNPIGFTVEHQIKEKIAHLLHEYQVYCIEDDVYQELYYEQNKKPLPMSYFDQQESQKRGRQQHFVLHCSSFSKLLGASIRIGWVNAGAFSQQIQHLQLMSTISANPLIQHALVEFLSSHHYEKHLHQLRLKLKQNKLDFYQSLKVHLPKACDIFYYTSSYFIWVKLPQGVDSMRLFQQLIQQSIGISPSVLFRSQHDDTHFFRINCSAEFTPQLDVMIQKIAYQIKKLF